MDSSAQGYITDLAYTDNYYPQHAPVTLNYLAAINGFRPRDLSDFDYCELGCGTGLSLLLHAAATPGGRFVGIDVNSEHIRQAQENAAQAGIGNLTLLAEPVGDALAGSGLPMFDFIVMHGLYTYINDAVKAQVLGFIDSRLKPGGMVFVSYNALPGAAGHQALGESMRRFAMPLTADSLERVRLGLSYLRLMLNAQAPFFRLNPELAKYAESLFDKDERYIAHEFFNESWNPYSLDQVAADMHGVGLEFAGTLPLWQNHPEADVPENLAAFFASLPDRLAREAHKDFIYNTVFRSDVYIRPADDQAQRIDRKSALWDMPFASVTPGDAVRLDVHSGAMALPLNTRDSRVVLSLLQEQARTPAQLAANPSLSALAPEKLIEILCWWVLSAQVRPAPPPDKGAPPAPACDANTALVTRALRESAHGKVWLASPRFGTAFEFDRLHALALCAASAAVDTSPETHLCELIARCGLVVEEDGGQMPQAELQDLAAQLYAELESGGMLEHARQLGLTR